MFTPRLLTAFTLTVLLASSGIAQTSEADLSGRLIKKPLYLRGQWHDNKLVFDESGGLIGKSAPITFTLAGIEIEAAQLLPDSLALKAHRVGLEFNRDMPKRVALHETMSIKIAKPQSGDFSPALDAIFSDNISDFAPNLPTYWQSFAHEHLLPTSIKAAPPPGSNPQPSKKPAATLPEITAPRLLKAVEPKYSSVARSLNYSANVAVGMMIDTTGKPGQFRIVHPAGLGLDEMAVDSVSKYTFHPAMQAGSPVAVELIITVNFETF